MADERERLRATFDAAADRYEQARPAYPAELYAALVRLTGLRPGDRVLEIGCATGKATRPLAAHGVDITCLEIGGALVAAARRNLAALRERRGGARGLRDVDPATGRRVRSGLRRDRVALDRSGDPAGPARPRCSGRAATSPTGRRSMCSPTAVTRSSVRSRRSTRRSGEGLPGTVRSGRGPDELPDDHAELEASGWFDRVTVEHFDWEVSTTRTATSRCSTPSPGTSPWSRGNENACTARSGTGWRRVRTGDSGGTGARCSTWRAGRAEGRPGGRR